MKTDSLNLPGYPEASQDATFVTGQATRVFRSLAKSCGRENGKRNIPEEGPQGTFVIVSGNGEDSELELSEVAVKEPEDWRYLFGMPSVRSKTKRFLEMAARFNAKDVGFGRENDTLLVLPSVGMMSARGRRRFFPTVGRAPNGKT